MWRDSIIEEALQKVREANLAAHDEYQKCRVTCDAQLQGKIVFYEHYGRKYKGRVRYCRVSNDSIIKAVVQSMKKNGLIGSAYHAIKLTQIESAMTDQEYLKQLQEEKGPLLI